MSDPDASAAPSDLLFNQSLEKGLAVLSAFNSRRRTMTLAEAAAAAGISKSSAQRMVHTLEVLGLVRKQAQTRRYELTPRALQIGFAYLAADALIELANPSSRSWRASPARPATSPSPTAATWSTSRAS